VNIPAVLYLQEPHRHYYEALPRLPWVAQEFSRGWWRSPKHLWRRTRNFLALQAVRVGAREELRNAQGFASILVNSHYSRESVMRAYGLNAKVCYLGIDTKLFVNQERVRERFVVGIGAFMPSKNIDFVIRALAYLKQPRPPLIWIGSFTTGSYLEETSRASQVTQRRVRTQGQD
jgi:glycosyltransferase involved in cell wall biosynthesis